MSDPAPPGPGDGEQSRIYRRRDLISIGGAGSALSSVGLLIYLLQALSSTTALVEHQGATLAAVSQGVAGLQEQQTALHRELDRTRQEYDGRLAACELRGLSHATRIDEIERGLSECRKAVAAVDQRRRDDRAEIRLAVRRQLDAAGLRPDAGSGVGAPAAAVAGESLVPRETTSAP